MSRRRLPVGVTRTPAGYLAQIMIRRHRRTRRFPSTTPLDDVVAWRNAERERLRRLIPAGAARGTFAHDVETYLERWHARDVHPATREQRERYLRLWSAVFGDRARHSIRTSEIAAHLAHWRDHGLPDSGRTNAGRPKRAAPTSLAPATVAKLRQAIYQLYALLDRGAGVLNPVADVELPPARPLPIRGVSLDVVDRVFAAMPPGVHRDHLAVVAYAGLRPSEACRIRPEHLARVGASTLLAVVTAKGGPPAVLPLLPEALDALERLLAAGAVGRYHSACAGLALRRACKAAGVPPMRVYDLRHSLGSAVLAVADQRTAQAALRHASITTTHRYTLAAVDGRVRDAFAALERRRA